MRNVSQTLRVVLGFMGPLLIALGCFLLLPLFLVLLCGEASQGHPTAFAFLLPSGLAFLLGLFCMRVFGESTPNRLQATLICSLGWLGFSAIGAIPYVIGIGATYLDGYFEAMSGFTTTGITMFTGLDSMPRSILFWRSLTQWVGGLGILTMFMAVIFKGGATHRLFGAEGHKINVGRPVPGLANTIKILFSIYFGFTAFIGVALLAAGMPAFDSICHSFTALSTGGFSPYDASIEYYRLAGHPNYIIFDYIIILGMFLGGTSFVIHYRVLKGSYRALYDNLEVRYWWGLIGAFTALIFLERVLKVEPLTGVSLADVGFWARMEQEFRVILFQVVAIITTTGFGTRDIGTPFFGEAARQFFLVMMVIGGCVGSTGGGLKVLRIAILGKLLRREVYKLRVPAQAISYIIVDGDAVDLDEIKRVGALFFAWVTLLIVGGAITEFLSDHSGYAALSGMFSALGNIGPCYIPVAQMGQLNPLIKVTYILGMLAGRLEILPVLLLFSVKAWKT